MRNDCTPLELSSAPSVSWFVGSIAVQQSPLHLRFGFERASAARSPAAAMPRLFVIRVQRSVKTEPISDFRPWFPDSPAFSVCFAGSLGASPRSCFCPQGRRGRPRHHLSPCCGHLPTLPTVQVPDSRPPDSSRPATVCSTVRIPPADHSTAARCSA